MSIDRPDDRPIRVLLVDDDPMVRTGLRVILDDAAGIEIAGEAADGTEVADAAARHWPDVVLMDVRMPRMDGIAALSELQKRVSPPKVIMLTSFDVDEDVYHALEAGAMGFLLKDATPDELAHAIRVVHSGQAIISPRSTLHLLSHFHGGRPEAERRQATERCAALTSRELQVARAVSLGMSNQEVADDQHCSVGTVKAHLSRIMAKLDVPHRIGIALTLQRAGLL
ncbi:response regulator transcription factor [Sediminivirga luteola]|uniref:DNA-binding response regulator n=1 Tax=Sediminivirga luteola TaxID=1774748 RepID=A0A8J2TZS6_9MICO|nr:response regulator transcription factor [Sediminivirga luteola]GGA21675.1 DNA-binding response regulator [Sediminivirga luteola]